VAQEVISSPSTPIREIGFKYPSSDYRANRPSKPYIRTEVVAGLELNDVY
jgi:hypothetical protein